MDKIKDKGEFLEILRRRFEDNPHRHPSLKWAEVAAKLEKAGDKIAVLMGMEESGGEPDAVDLGGPEGAILYADCSPESPAGRRSFCYDREALDSRKANKPADSVTESAGKIGITLLSEEQYRRLQELGEFDLKTSSWILTPGDVRQRGGALFCDRRFGRVFTYHNGADSYYAARGFRGCLAL